MRSHILLLVFEEVEKLQTSFKKFSLVYSDIS